MPLTSSVGLPLHDHLELEILYLEKYNSFVYTFLYLFVLFIYLCIFYIYSFYYVQLSVTNTASILI